MAPTPAQVAAAVRLAGAAVRIADATTGRVLLDQSPATPEPPASTTKLLTAVAALTVLGPGRQLVTQARVAHLPDSHGTVVGDLALVGGGDPTLTRLHARDGRASLQDLADQIRAAGVTRITGRIVADTSLFTPETSDPGWDAGYITGGSVAPVQSLEVDGGRITPGAWITPRVGAPALAAAQMLFNQLRLDHVTVDGAAVVAPAPRGSRVLTEVKGLPIGTLVYRMLQQSDNDLAEALGRLVAIDYGRPGSSTEAGTAVVAVLGGLGVPVEGVTLDDTSGLSRGDRLTAQALVAVLHLITSADHPVLRPILRGLPVAGRSGTLAGRYQAGTSLPGAGKVRAKTGAINGVSTLAGVVPTRSGRLLLFSFALQGVSRAGAELALDTAAADLAQLP